MTNEELQSMDFRCYVTAAGFNYEATAKALSKTVNIKYIQLDRGMLAANQSPVNLTQMVDSYGEPGRFNASVTEDPDNPGGFIVSCNIPADHNIDGKGYVINGAAAVLDNGIIYAYRRVESDYKVVGQGSAKSYIIRLRFLPANADLISFTIDPSVVLVTQADLVDQKKILIAADADVLKQAKAYADLGDKKATPKKLSATTKDVVDGSGHTHALDMASDADVKAGNGTGIVSASQVSDLFSYRVNQGIALDTVRYAQDSVSKLTTAPLKGGLTSLSSTEKLKFIPFYHSTSISEGIGWTSHLSVGQYKTYEGSWNNSGFYIATGGNDYHPTSSFRFSANREIASYDDKNKMIRRWLHTDNLAIDSDAKMGQGTGIINSTQLKTSSDAVLASAKSDASTKAATAQSNAEKSASSALASHVSAKDPHSQYLLTANLPDQMKTHHSLGIIDRGAAPKVDSTPSVWGNPGDGFDARVVYDQGYPETYGNIYTMLGNGYTQIFQSWASGNTGAHSHLYLRMKRDIANDWGSFSTVWDSVNLPKASESVAQAGTDDTHWMTPLKTQLSIQKYLDGNGIEAPGKVAYFAISNPPKGWIKANGAKVSRTTYAALFKAIGTTFGQGDGSTTFQLPDLRDEFIRGVGDDRTLGSAQDWAIENITGTFDGNSDDGSSAKTGAFYIAGTFNGSNGSGTGGIIHFDASRVVKTSTETRPRNVALLACIKY